MHTHAHMHTRTRTCTHPHAHTHPPPLHAHTHAHAHTHDNQLFFVFATLPVQFYDRFTCTSTSHAAMIRREMASKTKRGGHQLKVSSAKARKGGAERLRKNPKNAGRPKKSNAGSKRETEERYHKTTNNRVVDFRSTDLMNCVNDGQRIKRRCCHGSSLQPPLGHMKQRVKESIFQAFGIMDVIRKNVPRDEKFGRAFPADASAHEGEQWLATMSTDAPLRADVHSEGEGFPGGHRHGQQRTLHVLLQGECNFQFYKHDKCTPSKSHHLKAGDGLLFDSRCLHMSDHGSVRKAKRPRTQAVHFVPAGGLRDKTTKFDSHFKDGDPQPPPQAEREKQAGPPPSEHASTESGIRGANGTGAHATAAPLMQAPRHVARWGPASAPTKAARTTACLWLAGSE